MVIFSSWVLLLAVLTATMAPAYAQNFAVEFAPGQQCQGIADICPETADPAGCVACVKPLKGNCASYLAICGDAKNYADPSTQCIDKKQKLNDDVAPCGFKFN